MSHLLRRMRQGLVGNLPYKVLSVLIALALWFIVRDERIEATLAITLDVQPGANLVVSNEHLPELTVGVTGTRAALSRLRNASLAHVVHPKVSEPGSVTIRIRPEDLDLPAGVSAVNVAPGSTPVRLEARAVRRVPVKARILAAEGTGWRVRRVYVLPERVRIAGPSSVVTGLGEVWTEAIEVTPRGPETIVGQYAVSLPHRQLRLEEAGPVEVRIELEESSAAEVMPSPAGVKVNGRAPGNSAAKTASR